MNTKIIKKFRILHRETNDLYGAIFSTENNRTCITHAAMTFLKNMNKHIGKNFVVQVLEGTEWVDTEYTYTGIETPNYRTIL